jgi:hypothetical protein
VEGGHAQGYAAVMRLFLPTLALLAASCAHSLPEDEPATNAIGRRAIERIERGFALSEDLEAVGVTDTAEMNRNSKVKVRNLLCQPAGADAATCSYDASRCLVGEGDADGDGWCRRTRTFVRTEGYSGSLTAADGWDVPQP